MKQGLTFQPCEICGGEVVESSLTQEYYQCSSCRSMTRKHAGAGERSREFDVSREPWTTQIRLSIAARMLRRTIQTHFTKKKLRILEVGFGRGTLLARFAKDQHTVWGIEPEEALFKRLSQQLTGLENVNLICGRLAEVELPRAFFDLICMVDVIEHLEEPEKDLEKLRESLAEGGGLFLRTPNGESRGLKIFKDNWVILDDPGHHWVFSPKSLQMLLEKSGLEVLEIGKTSLLDGFAAEGRSAFKWLNLDIGNPYLRVIAVLILEFFFLPMKLIYPDMHPNMEALAVKAPPRLPIL